jgi:transposase
MHLAAGGQPVFPPIVWTYLTKLACELPDDVGRSLALWTCAELARTLVRDGFVDAISPQTVQRILQSSRLKPWRVHHWLSAKVPRDEAFREIVLDLCDLYTREPVRTERIVSLDELTSIQPRSRSAATKPAQPGLVPVLLEHEYERKGAWNLFAAFDIQTGEVIAQLHRRKRQKETIALLEAIDKDTPKTVKTIHVISDNISIHKGKLARQWLERHPRFKMHHTPVHCSWMNQVEQWFSILRRKRLRAPNFADLDDLAAKINQFVIEWNEIAHPFNWSAASFDKILAKIDEEIALKKAA